MVVENYLNCGCSWLRFMVIVSFILAHSFLAHAAPSVSSSEVSIQLNPNSVIACMTDPVFMNEQE